MSDENNTPDPATDSTATPAPGSTPEATAPDPATAPTSSTPDPASAPDAPQGTPVEAGAWRDSITDEKLRTQAERYNSPTAAMEGILALRQQVSKALIVPGKDADEIQIAQYRKQIDVPAEAKDYEFPKLEGEDDTPEAHASHDRWKTLLHENNVPRVAAKSILDAYHEDVVKAKQAEIDADDKYTADAEAKIRTEWGADYEKNKALANKAVETMFGETFDSMRQLQDKSGKFVLDNPAFIRAFATIGREMGEGTLGEPTLTDTQLEDLNALADSYRAKRNEAKEAGREAEAIRWDEKEREVLGKIHGTQGIIGQGGRQL